jgi:predicted ATPase/class 3 adenylate cyclase/Tfp pilus assembly protein PilF
MESPAVQERQAQPTGRVTFLFTDIEGSTKLWEQHPGAMSEALKRHNALLSDSIEAHGGYIFKSVGDGFCAAFETPQSALMAAVAAQKAIYQEEWGEQLPPLHVRIGLCTGFAEERAGDYFGPPLNRVSRLLSAGYGGQTLVAASTEQLLDYNLPGGISLLPMGEHRLRDLQNTERIFQLVIPDLPGNFPPLRTLTSRPNNLPLQPTTFIGRTKELKDAINLLRRHDVRLVTFTGPGGSGKTRLALQVAAQLIDEYEHGIFFASLEAINDPSLVVSAIVRTLGVREGAGLTEFEALREHLQNKHLLLVLDNSEQLSSTPRILSELVAVAPHLKVLVTGRAALHLYGEHEFPVPAMSLPPLEGKPGKGPDYLAKLSQAEVVRLFVERAQAVKPDFVATEGNVHAIVSVCRRLDGLPLAIELAAARIRILSPQALMSRLESSLKILTGGAEDLPPRQRTLRNAIEWSYDLLGAEEKDVFALLSVFQGGCTVEAAEALVSATCDEMDAATTQPDALDLVSSLVDKNLLRQSEADNGEARLSILQTLREYATERLEQSGRIHAARRLHAEYYFALAERAKPNLTGQEQRAWLDQLDIEHDNLRSALEWARHENITMLVCMSGALRQFWTVRGYLTEGRHWLEVALANALERGNDVPPAMQAEVRAGASVMALDQGDYDHATILMQQNLDSYRQLGDRRNEAYSLSQMAVVATHRGHYQQSQELFEESLRLRRAIEDKEGVAASLNNLGHVVTILGEHPRAQLLLEESLAIFRAIGQRRGESISLNNLGRVAHLQGNTGLARSRYEESLLIKRELSDKVGIASSLSKLGAVAQSEGDYERAGKLYYESLTLFHSAGDRQSAIPSLLGLAEVARISGHSSRAGYLIGLVQALLEATGGALDPAAGQEYEHIKASVKADLGEAAWEAASSRGRTWTLEQAIADIELETSLEPTLR